jgi:squalene synthase HpnC
MRMVSSFAFLHHNRGQAEWGVGRKKSARSLSKILSLAMQNFELELAKYGPQASPPKKAITLRQARKYCRKLARRHYENFTVASFLLPRRLKRHFYNIYAYCRWADDLADETGDPQKSLALLGWWKKQLDDCYRGKASHPVFIALADTVKRFDIPAEPFVDLLAAFRQDQQTTRYDSIDRLLEYCRYSANPVGRLVLYLRECFSAERAKLSDSICTGLQLANFCQDVARDWQRGRIYLPLTDCHRFGCTEATFAKGEPSEAFRQLMTVEVEQAEGYLRAGSPLIKMMPPELQLDIALFIAGGLAILQAIRRENFDVWTKRPTVARMEKFKLLAKCWWQLKTAK